MTDPTAADILSAWLARYDANDEAAAHGRPIKWDAEGNVTATAHNFDDVIPPMDVDEVEAVRKLLDEREQLLVGVECVLLDHVAELSGPMVDANLADLAYRFLAVAGDAAPAEIRDALATAEELAALCERCGGDPCSTCGECPRQGCWDCRCGQQDRDDNEQDSEGN